MKYGSRKSGQPVVGDVEEKKEIVGQEESVGQRLESVRRYIAAVEKYQLAITLWPLSRLRETP